MKWVFTQDASIDGVEFKKGDTVEGAKGVIGKDDAGNVIEGLWVKWHTGKKIKVPLSVLSQTETSQQVPTQSGKSLLQAVGATPTWSKILPLAGAAIGLGFAHHKGGSYGKYAAWGFGMALLASIPLMLKTWENMRSGTAGVEAGLRNQILDSQKKAPVQTQRSAPQVDPAEQARYVAELTAACAALLRSTIGMDPDANLVRTVNQIFQGAKIDQHQFQILLDYITTSTEINLRNLDENENALTLKPLFDKLDGLQKQIMADQVMISVVQQLSPQ